jgi:hypothetical protein
VALAKVLAVTPTLLHGDIPFEYVDKGSYPWALEIHFKPTHQDRDVLEITGIRIHYHTAPTVDAGGD